MSKLNLKNRIRLHLRHCKQLANSAREVADTLEASHQRCALLMKQLYEEGVLIRERTPDTLEARHRTYLYRYNHEADRGKQPCESKHSQ